MRLLVILLAVAACDPIWNVHARLRDPTSRPIVAVTLAVACASDQPQIGSDKSQLSDYQGNVEVSGLGAEFPVGCDIYIAKPGFQTERIRYRELCLDGPAGCKRVFDFEMMLVPTSGALRRAF